MGHLLTEKPIDTRAAPNVAGVSTPIDGAAELTELMVKGDFQTCFARQYFRWAFQRPEDLTQDGCLLRSLQDLALEGRPLPDVLMAIALSDRFKERDLR